MVGVCTQNTVVCGIDSPAACCVINQSNFLSYIIILKGSSMSANLLRQECMQNSNFIKPGKYALERRDNIVVFSRGSYETWLRKNKESLRHKPT